jgi:DNA polymerase-3 subunit beta
MMKIVTTAGQLRAGLATVLPVVERWMRTPILSGVLLDGASVTGTDLDVEVRAAFATSEAGGRAVVPARLLSRLLLAFDADEVLTLSRAEGAVAVTLDHARGRVVLPGFEPADWPELPFTPEGAPVTAGEGFAQAIARCLPYVCREETRFYLQNVLIEAGLAVATDGHRLAAEPCGLRGEGALSSVLLPMDAAGRVARLAGPVTVTAGAMRRARFEAGGVRVTAKLCEATYPNWRRVVPSGEPALRMTLDVAATLRALRRASALLGDGPRSVRLVMSSSVVVIEARVSDGTALEEVVAGARVEANGGTGDAVVLEVDGRYFAQLLRNWAGASEVVIEKGDFVVAGQKPNFKGGAAAGAPLVLRGEPDADGLARMALLMPMRLDTPPSDYAMRLLARCGELVAA